MAITKCQLGTVAVRRAGRDLTILANMLMVHRALAAAERLAELGIDAEVIDVRCLVPLDMATIERSVAKNRSGAYRRGGPSHRRLGRRGRS